MTLSLADLTRLRTRDELRDALITELSARGFPVTSWALGGVARTLVEGVAQGTADVWLAVSAVAGGVLLDTSTGDWLTALALSHYGVTRVAATFATGYVRLTALAGAGPYNVAPASVIVSDGVRTFRSTNAGTIVLAAGGYVDVPVRADVAGAAGNVPSITVLVAPSLAGVSVSSPAYGGGATWRTNEAVDTESDTALRARCRARWATLAVAGCGTRAAYAYQCTTATLDDGTSAGVTRVGFLPSSGTGDVLIRIAGASGLLSDTQRDAVRAWVDLRKPVTDTPSIEHATAVVTNPIGSVAFKSGLNTSTNRAAVIAAITSYVNALPIGDGVTTVTLDQGAIYAAIYAAVPGGIVDVDLSAPTDQTIGAGAIALVTDVSQLGFSP